ncbi:MAG: AAA family ATPase [Micrococcales bacterium]|nr:AAA family ATPase [Micrococcales bacterium]
MTDAARTDPAAPAPAAAAGDSRVARVAAAAQGWQRSLVDLGGRNSLLWYRDLPSGTLDLTTAHPGGVSMLMTGRTTKLSQLVREPAALLEARRRARAIHDKALELREERGIAAGFVAIGMATWSVPKAARPPASPVLLRPCVLRPTGATHEDFELDLGPGVEFNPVLREYLRAEQQIEVDADALTERAHRATNFDPYPVFAALEEMCAAVPDFAISRRLVLGTFSYAKLPMVADLAQQGDSLADHDVVAALAGDEAALSAIRTRLPEPVADPDPEQEYLVLDADSSQQAAIDAVRAGAHLVIDGPPGTGKSQTIANLIAALAAEGRSTLFVAEKRAAIDVVLRRLDRVGLGDLVLDAYDGAINKRAIAQQFQATLDTTLDAALDAALRQPTPGAHRWAPVLRARRERLVRHVEALHRIRDPWGVSAHDVQQAMTELAARPVPPSSHVRLPGPVIEGLTRSRAIELGRRLRDAAGLGAWVIEGDDPWFGARISTQEDAARALELTTRLSTAGLDGVSQQLDSIMTESRVPRATSLADWTAAFATMSRVRETLEVFRPEVFDVPLGEYIAATAPREWRRAHQVQMGMLARWRTRRQARRLLRPGRPPARLHDEFVSASEQRKHWFELVGGGGRPEISPRVEEGMETVEALGADLGWLSERLATTSEGELMDSPLRDLRDRLARLAASPDRLAVLPQVTGILDEARAAGLGDLVEGLATRRVPTEQVTAEVDHVWWASLQREITVRDPLYGAHDGPGLRRTVDEYVHADRAHIASTVERVRAAVAGRVREVIAAEPAHESLIRAEAGKARRHKALRELMPEASAALTAIKPCWAMSPLVVAATLPPGRWFDVVIFDEASQVQPAQAISAISRARQVVVVGDERQLPPTNFSIVVSDEDEACADETPTAGSESILDELAAALPTRHLDWHYRSRDERLIAFANQHIYGGRLATFPGTSIESAIVFEPVDGQAVVQPGAESIDTTEAEVERVVHLVLDHARTRPDESLGVITLGIRHAKRIEEALTTALSDAPAVAGFFAEDKDERFFVKDLERVQGDERDAVIVSIGYGKTPHGRVLHRFGPLSIEGGERRLTVAITRARTRVTVVSSLRADDLDPDRLKAQGALMLRAFLAFAETGDRVAGPEPGAAAMAEQGPAPDPLRHDPLRHDLARRLRREGLTVHENFGSAAHRIDLAVEDPYRRGRAIVAIETDGSRYAAVHSTRERDRLRPEHLTQLGWKHVRVWSTDLFRDPAREISRILKVARDEHIVPHEEAMQDQIGRAEPRQEPAPPDGDHMPAETSDPADATDLPHPAKRRRRRRRVFRKGTAGNPDYEESPAPPDATGVMGNPAPVGAEQAARDRWLAEQRPPHYE